MEKKRWTAFFALFFSNVSTNIASPWSVFYPALVRSRGWSASQVSMVYSLMLISAFLGNMTAAQCKRRISASALLLWGGAMMGAGWTLASILLHLWALYLLIGFSAGFGAGLILNTVTSEIPRRFPERKGFVIGAVSSSGALAGIFYAPVGAAAISAFGIGTAMKMMGAFYFLMILPGVFALRGRTESTEPEAAQEAPKIRSFFLRPVFLSLWVFLLLNAMAGTFISSQASALMQQIWNYTEAHGARVVSFYAAATLAGRVLVGRCSDKLPRAKVLLGMALATTGAFAVMLFANAAELFSAAVIFSGFCFGGLMTTMPAYCSDCFGNRHFAKYWGIMYGAYTVSSLFGPVMASVIAQGKDYRLMPGIFCGILLASILIFAYQFQRKEDN